MDIYSHHMPIISRNARDVAVGQSIPAARAEAMRRREEADRQSDFFEYMEVGMTCVVLVGAVLFAAGLAMYGLPVSRLRDGACVVLYALAAAGGVGLGGFILAAIFRRAGVLGWRG